MVLGNKSTETSMEKIEESIKNIDLKLNKIKLHNLIENIDSHKNYLIYNFIIGMFRGFGMAVGFTILGAILIYFLQKIVLLHIPVIGDFVSDIVRIVQENLNTGR